MATTLRVMTEDCILESEVEYRDEYEALAAMDEVTVSGGYIVQVIIDGLIYAEKAL